MFKGDRAIGGLNQALLQGLVLYLTLAEQEEPEAMQNSPFNEHSNKTHYRNY